MPFPDSYGLQPPCVPKLVCGAQRAYYSMLVACHPACRRAFQWCRTGFQLNRSAYERKALARLRWLTARLGKVGALDPAAIRALQNTESFDCLSALPVLTRHGLLELVPLLMQIKSRSPRAYFRSTSGSAGMPVSVLRDTRMDLESRAFRMAMLELLGWRPGIPRIAIWGASLGGKFELPLPSPRATTMVHGSFEHNYASFERFLSAIKANPGCVVYGYSSLLVACSAWMLSSGYRLPPGLIRAAWSSGEVLYRCGRSIFEEVFGVPLRDLYGSREMDAIAVECPYGTRHVNARYIVEALDPKSSAPLREGDTGELVITDLFNTLTPLLRYRIGDLGAVAWDECRCGRTGYTIQNLSGRVSDVINLPNGRSVHSAFLEVNMMDTDVSISSRIHQFQIMRVGPWEFEFLYQGELLPEEKVLRLANTVKRHLDGAQVKVRRVEQIDRNPAGKLIAYHDLTRAKP